MNILRTLAALLLVSTTVQAAERSPQVNYLLRCQGCHLADGAGLPAAGIPDFVDQVGVFAGLAEGRQYLMHVPGVIGSSLSDHEIADVLNYIMETYSGSSLPAGFQPFTAGEVASLRATEIGNVVKYRRVVVDKLAQLGLAAADYPWP